MSASPEEERSSLRTTRVGGSVWKRGAVDENFGVKVYSCKLLCAEQSRTATLCLALKFRPPIPLREVPRPTLRLLCHNYQNPHILV